MFTSVLFNACWTGETSKLFKEKLPHVFSSTLRTWPAWHQSIIGDSSKLSVFPTPGDSLGSRADRQLGFLDRMKMSESLGVVNCHCLKTNIAPERKLLTIHFQGLC